MCVAAVYRQGSSPVASILRGPLLPHRRMLPNSSRLLIDAHRPDVNRSLLTIGPTAFG